ncbi:hypothetical protein [Costertonia aggregata]|uniref:Uncharacterized protein n=1 Tax=Costertonia aggregata TaxID=343403 RepID=A0A7H9ARN0_9FLAO|nr:hypothetical protein [Costertonia aggregata]QLG46076.1 hypothetical protein HYG79_12205 [Costertonia aggregata]
MRHTMACFLLVQFFFQSVTAQAPSNYNADNESFGMQPALQYAFQQLNSKSLKNLDKTNIKGSPFYREGFVKGLIYSQDGLEGQGFMRYDGYNDEVQLKSSTTDTTIFKLTQSKDLHCILGKEKVVYRKYFDKNDEVVEGHLFELVRSDDIVLYERRMKKYKEGKEATTSFELPVANRFVLQTELYYSNQKDKEIRFLKPSKKKVLDLFKTEDKIKNDKLKKFISGNRLNYKDARDVVQIFYYYDNL